MFIQRPELHTTPAERWQEYFASEYRLKIAERGTEREALSVAWPGDAERDGTAAPGAKMKNEHHTSLDSNGEARNTDAADDCSGT